uniref:KIF-binding protein n=1 Tax=Dermatophagoides pteronyssinus TaxID=6956 RepID=A0A6P6YAC7_DERPT|nr:KIF1-binding protein homolog [Dermatophagoides pteronyssinus]
MSLSFNEWLLSVRQTFDKLSDDEFPHNVLKSLENLSKQSDNIVVDDQKSDRYWLLLWYIHLKVYKIFCKLGDFVFARIFLGKCQEILHKQFPFFGLIIFLNDDQSIPPSSDTSMRNSFAGLLIDFLNQIISQTFNDDMNKNSHLISCYIKEVESIYDEWNNQNPHPAFIGFDDILKLDVHIIDLHQIIDSFARELDDDDPKRMNNNFLTTMELAAQFYQAIEMAEESAHYCLKSLMLQYPLLNTKLTKIDHIDWALNMATLSQYYAGQNQFESACHMMACARKVLDETNEQVKQNEMESFKKAHADLDIIEVKYCLMIFDESRELIDKPDYKIPTKSIQPEKIFSHDPDVIKMEEQFPKFPIRDYQQAKKAYQYALAAIERAKKFFTINERCSDHINCIFDHSSIHGSMLSFLDDIDSRCKMNKRRIDLFEGLLKEISPDHFIKYYRKLLYELGDLYSNQVSLKMEQYEQNYLQQQQEIQNIRSNEKETILDEQEIKTKLRLNNERNIHVMKKVNILIQKSIIYFYRFLSSFNEFNSDKLKKIPKTIDELIQYQLPDKIKDDEYIKPILTAYMMIGKMYTNLYYINIEQRKQQWTIGGKYYSELKSYLDRNVEHREKYFQQYYQQLLELLELIQIQLNK